MKIENIALQLYTVREESAKDFFGTLEKVADIGYKGVEFAGFFDADAKELKAKLDDLGLVTVGSHTSVTLLKESLDDVIEYNKILNNKKIIIPWAQYESIKDVEEMISFCKEISPKIKENGMTLLYHNHAHELEEIDGIKPLDMLLEESGDSLMSELDTYWVTKAGFDAIEYMKQIGSKVKAVHLKDMADTEEREYTEVGAGIIDEAGIIDTAQALGVDTFIVEHDEPTIPCLESAKISFNNLKKMGYV